MENKFSNNSRRKLYLNDDIGVRGDWLPLVIYSPVPEVDLVGVDEPWVAVLHPVLLEEQEVGLMDVEHVRLTCSVFNFPHFRIAREY